MVGHPAAGYLGFALGAAVLFGLGPVLAKRGLAEGGTWLGNTVTVIATRTALFWIALVVASAGTGLFASVSPTAVLIFALAGIAASGLARLFLYVGVDRVGSSLSAAVTNTRPLFAVLLGVAWLRETVTPRMVAGVVLLVAGLVVLSRSRGGDVRGWHRVDLAIPLLAAVTWALGNAGRRYGFTATDPSVLQALVIGETAALAAIGGVAVVTGRAAHLRAPRRAHALFVGSGVVAGAGLFLLFGALRRGPVSVVDPVVATAPLFTVALAAGLLRDLERITPRVAAGAVTIVVGAALVI